MEQQQVTEQRLQGPWTPFSVRAGKGRAVVRHWIKGPNGQRAGHFMTPEAAQAACDQLNTHESASA